MTTTAQEYNRDGDRTAQPAPLAFWDPVSETTYMFEIDPADPKIPVDAIVTVPPLQYTRNATATNVTRDTATAANNRPLPVELMAGDSAGPIDYNAGNASAATQRVVIATDQAPIDVEVTASVLPTGAATEATQLIVATETSETSTNTLATALAVTSIDTKTPALVGGRVPVASRTQDGAGTAITSTLVGSKQSIDVNIAQDESLTEVVATGTITANGQSVTTGIVNGYGSKSIFVSIGGSGITLNFECSVDGSTWNSLDVLELSNGFVVTTTSTQGGFLVVNNSARYLRARASSYGSGTQTITFYGARATNGPMEVVNTVAANLVTRAGNFHNTVDTNFGTPGANTVRVAAVIGVGLSAVSSTNPVPVTSGNGAAAIQLVSASRRPYFQDFSLANLTTSYTQIIASTGSIINRFFATNNSSTAILIATGAAASEVVQYILMPGENAMDVPLQIAASTRISIAAQTGTLTSGQFSFNALA